VDVKEYLSLKCYGAGWKVNDSLLENRSTNNINDDVFELDYHTVSSAIIYEGTDYSDIPQNNCVEEFGTFSHNERVDLDDFNRGDDGRCRRDEYICKHGVLMCEDTFRDN
jgi:hypothetical protein